MKNEYEGTHKRIERKENRKRREQKKKRIIKKKMKSPEPRTALYK